MAAARFFALLVSLPWATSLARTAVRPVSLGYYGGLACVFLSDKPLVEDGLVFPVPVDEECVALLEGLMDGTKLNVVAGGAKLVNRDGGVYDNLPWQWGRGERPKAGAFAQLALQTGLTISPYHALLETIGKQCCAEVSCGYIERASLLDDEDGQLVIGATLSVRESAEMVELYGERVPLPREVPLRTAEVEVRTDEMIGLALAADVPVQIDTDVWRAGAVPARFAWDERSAKMRVALQGPGPGLAEREKAQPSSKPRALWELGASEFRALKPSALARALLSSGVGSLPRPREAGLQALRELAMPLLDSAVRNQLQLADAIEREDYAAAQQLVGAKSKRQLVAEAMQAAAERGELALARTLRERLDVLEALTHDTTAEEGSHDRYLDQDEWYAAEQRRIYGPKKARALGGLGGGGRRPGAGEPAWAACSRSFVRRSHLRMGWFDSVSDLFTGAQVDLGGNVDGGAPPDEASGGLRLQVEEALSEEGFDGFALRQLLLDKWGKAFDLDFTLTRYMGRESLYLNVFPWTPEREPFRHADEQSYLEHLQAVADLLIKWQRVALVKQQIRDTTKEPRRGTIPLKTVPLRLDLPDEMVRSFQVPKPPPET